MRVAFKEWAVVVDALGRGEQILILRKGGISETGRRFEVQHPRFFLFPTWFHQQRESVIPSAQARYDALAAGGIDPTQVTIQFYGEVIRWLRVISREALSRLRGQHIWQEEVIARRFEWGRREQIHALTIRVFQLPKPAVLPVLPSYGGCRSWVDLDRQIEIGGALPVLSDDQFESRQDAFWQALEPAGVGD